MPPMRPKQLFLVEDDPALSRLMTEFLQDEGFVVTQVLDGAEVMSQIKRQLPDIMVLDIMLPNVDGVEVCRQLRKQYDFPILMLTARDDDLVEVASLREGADNYLTKPVRPHVLLAHIQALLRRSHTPQIDSEPSQTIQGIMIDFEGYRAFKDGQELVLNQQELQILMYLFQQAGKLVSRDELYQAIRGIEYDGLDRSIDLGVSVLRKKLDDLVPPYKYIKTVRGKGYCLLKD